MKILSRGFLGVAVGCLVFALGSCVHYYAVNPPPEASQPGWDAESQTFPYIAAMRFLAVLAAGFCSLWLGLFCRGKVHNAKSNKPV